MANQPGISNSGGAWNWTCACGQTGTPVPEREKARDGYKEHRKVCAALASQSSPAGGNETVSDNNTATPEAKAKTKPAAKAAAKKSAPKAEGRKKREQSVSEAQAKGALASLKKGGTTLIAESKKLGFTHNGPLRAALRGLIGEKEYDKLMEGTKKVATGSKPAAKKASGDKKKPAAKKAAPKKAAATTDEQPKAAETPAPAAESTTQGATTE